MGRPKNVQAGYKADLQFRPIRFYQIVLTNNGVTSFHIFDENGNEFIRKPLRQEVKIKNEQ